MASSLASTIERQIAAAEGSYHRLVLVVGPSRSGKTPALQAVARRLGVPALTVNLLLSERLVGLAHQQRALRVADVLAEILESAGGPVVVLDNTEVLFDTGLHLDPLRLLQLLARRRVVIASWAGHLKDTDLSYAEPGHPEFRRYPRPDAILVPTRTDG
jgi:hypothetical protein